MNHSEHAKLSEARGMADMISDVRHEMWSRKERKCGDITSFGTTNDRQLVDVQRLLPPHEAYEEHTQCMSQSGHLEKAQGEPLGVPFGAGKAEVEHLPGE